MTYMDIAHLIGIVAIITNTYIQYTWPGRRTQDDDSKHDIPTRREPDDYHKETN